MAKLLSQKQKLLQQSIKETSSKLDVLKEADKQAKVHLKMVILGKINMIPYHVKLLKCSRSFLNFKKNSKMFLMQLLCLLKKWGTN